MADNNDATVTELTQKPASQGIANPFSAGEAMVAEEQRRENVANAEHSKSQSSFFYQALKTNTAKKIFDTVFTPQFEPREDFVNNDQVTLHGLEQYGVGTKYFKEVRDSKSYAEFSFYLRRAMEDTRVDEMISNSLSDAGRTTASVAGAIVDVDIALGLGAGALYKAGTSLAKIAAIEGTAEAALAATHYAVDDKYNLDDAALDMTIGLGVAVGAAKLFASLDNTSTPKITNTDTVQYSDNRLWTTDDLIKPEGFAVKPFGDVSHLDDVKFDAYKANREAFFDTQRNIHAQTLAKQIDEAKTAIRDIEPKIAEAKIKLSEAKNDAWRTRRQKELDNLREELVVQKEKLAVDLTKKPLSPDRAKLLNMVDNMAEDIITVKDELYDIVKGGTKGDIVELSETIKELTARFPKEMEAVNRLFNSKMNNKDVEKEIFSTDGVFKNLSKKQKIMLAGSALVTTSAAQAEGDESIAGEITGLFFGVMLIGLGGSKVLTAIKNADIRSSVSKVADSIKTSYHKAEVRMSPQATDVEKTTEFIVEGMHTRLTSTIAPFQKAGDEAAKIAEKILYSSAKGAGAETIKASWAHSTMAKYTFAENRAFKAWKAEQGVTFSSNFFDDMNAIHTFRKAVSDNMEMRNSLSPSIQAITKQNDEIMQNIWDTAKEYGVYGFEKMNYKAGMIPRLWKNAELNTLMGKISADDKTVLRNAIANMIFKTSADMTTATKQADKFIESWTKGFDQSMTANKADDVYGSIQHLLKDDAEFSDFADAMNVSKDKVARAKNRIDFNINDFEDIEVNIDGHSMKITKEHLVERDFKSLLDQVSNTMFGSAALARQGYKSVAQIDKAINTLNDPMIRHELNIAKNLVLGIPVPSNNKLVHEFSMIAKDLTIVAKLPLVVFSLPPEFMYTLANSGVAKGVRELTNSVLHTFGRESEMMASLADISGLATSVTRMDFSGYRGLTDNITDLDDAGIVSSIRETTMKMRDFSMLANGLSYFSDVLQRANLSLNAEKFANYIVKGDMDSTSGISASRLQNFGIDDTTKELFAGAFEFTEKGRLKAINTEKWTRRQKDKMAEILRDMNQQVSPETTIGETGLWTRSTDFGRIVSTLTAYPMQQFNVHGLEDLKHMDRMGLVHSFGSFAGSYIGLHARYAIQNKEVDDEKMALYALMNIPQLGALSSMSSIISPATQDTLKDGLAVIGMDKR